MIRQTMFRDDHHNLDQVQTQPSLPRATGRNIAIFALAAVLLSTALADPAQAWRKKKKKTLEGISLVWKPTDEIGEYGAINLTGLGSVEVQVQPLEDDRDGEPGDLGKNIEDADEGKILPVTTTDDVPDWVSGRVAYLLEQFGVETVDEGGTVVLSGKLKRFYVTEDNTYESDIGIKLKLATPGGKVLWEGLANGSAERFGRSYKAENYYEVLSDGLMEAVHGALDNDAFRKALKGEG